MFRRALRAGAVLLLTAAAAFTAGGASSVAAPSESSAPDPSAPGSHAVGHTDLTVSAAGRSFSARVWYPATSAGADTPVAPGPHPGLAFGHGFFQDVSRYASTLKHYASWGVITVAPKSQGGLFPSHSAFADDLNASLTWLTAQNATAGSRFFERVATDRLGLSGHSMGGGSAVLAASRNPAVRSVTTTAAAETRPSAADAARSLTIPVQFLGGEKDGIAGVADHQRKMYTAKPAPTQLRVILGGFHCGFIDTDGFGCDSGTIGRDAQLKHTRGVSTAWLRYTLAGDGAMHDLVWGPAAQNDPAVAYEAKP